MISVNVIDGTTVTVSGEAIIGPAVFYADEITVGGVDYSTGSVVVRDDEVIKVAEMAHVHYVATPYAVAFFFIAGLAWGAARKFGVVLAFACTVLSSHAALFRHNENVKNPEPDQGTFRISTFAAVETGGDSYFLAPSWSTPYSPYAFGGGLGYSGPGTLRIGIQPKNAGGSLIGPVIAVSIVNITLNGSGYLTSTLTYPAIAMPAGATKFARYFAREQPYYQAGWYLLTDNIPGVETNTPGERGRGALLDSWEFVLAGYASMQFDLEYAFDFTVVVEKLVQAPTPDGGYAYAWEPVEPDIPSTSVVDAPPAAPVVTPAGPDYEPDALPDDAERPASVTDTATLNDAQEARSTDEKNVLKQIRDAAAEGVNATAAGAKSIRDALAGDDGGTLPTDITSGEEAVDGALETEGTRVGELTDAIGDLQDTLLSVADKYSVAISGSAYPELGIQLPPALGGHFVEFDLETYAWVWSIFRFALLCSIGWYAINDAIDIIRGAFA